MSEKFSELDKVRVTHGGLTYEGYVIATLVKDGKRLYKLSVIEDSKTTFDNWVPEHWMKKIS